MSKRRYSSWSPTTDPLPPQVQMRRVAMASHRRPPGEAVTPLAEAPVEPGWWAVKLIGAYRLSLVEYKTATAISDAFAIGVAFYPATPAYPWGKS